MMNKNREQDYMKTYEIVATYLNGCAGAAYPQTSFEEVELDSPDDYILTKHSRDFKKFMKEAPSIGRTLYTYDTGTVTYIYEFTEL